MKKLSVILGTVLIVLGSCKGGENKADSSGPDLPEKVNAPVTAPNESNDTTTTNAGTSRGINIGDPAEILANIDSHLVSAVQFRAVPGGGISDCIVTVTNNLPDATFQKALVEVSIKREDGTNVRTDYYTVVNIAPGMSKVIKIPNQPQGASVTSKIVKIKSAELTNGEFVLAGNPK